MQADAHGDSSPAAVVIRAVIVIRVIIVIAAVIRFVIRVVTGAEVAIPDDEADAAGGDHPGKREARLATGRTSFSFLS